MCINSSNFVSSQCENKSSNRSLKNLLNRLAPSSFSLNYITVYMTAKLCKSDENDKHSMHFPHLLFKSQFIFYT